MVEIQYQDVLEILNFELNRKDMKVLGALLKSQRTPTTYVDFETIRSQLEIDEGGRKGKDSLIYRSLSWLENAGFIRVDRSEHKHGYNSDVGLMHRAFRQAISDATSTIESDMKKLEREIQSIDRIDANELGSDILTFAAGNQKIEKPVFVEGWDNVLQLLEDKIYSQVKRGDMIRFSLEWLSRVDVITPFRVDTLRNLMKNGVEFRGLEHNKISKKHLKVFKEFTLAYRREGFHPGFRIYERQGSTYQFVGRNEDGIVLITSEHPMSATWIPRKSNPPLVANAIQTFDSDYEKGTDIEELGRD
jgi:predicted transcriptional regulator